MKTALHWASHYAKPEFVSALLRKDPKLIDLQVNNSKVLFLFFEKWPFTRYPQQGLKIKPRVKYRGESFDGTEKGPLDFISEKRRLEGSSEIFGKK